MKGGRSCPEKVVANNIAVGSKKDTFSQRLAEHFTKIIRSWIFVVCQIVFVVSWIGFNHFFKHLAFDSSLTLLQIVLLTEGCCIGSIFLMTQYRQGNKDRAIFYNDYLLDIQIKKELKEFRPLLEEIYKDVHQDKK